jgi:hypothetical protein
MNTVDSAELRDSYLALSLQYERLAVILEKTASAADPAAVPKRQFWRRFRRKWSGTARPC